jgi:hypothetical protein
MDLVKLRRDSEDMNKVSMRWVEVENLLSSRLNEWAQGVHEIFLPSVKFKRKSAKLLILSELTKLMKDSEI